MSINSIGSVGGFDPTLMAQKMFKRLDANGDGSIDKTEFSKIAQRIAQDTGESVDGIFTKYDTDGNGVLSETEHTAIKPPKPPEQGETGDSDLLQSLKDVLSTMFQSLIDALGTASTDKKDENGVDSRPDPAQMAQQMFQKLDANSNGTVDETEFGEIAQKIAQDTGMNADKVLAAYDTNGDGILDETEFAKIKPPRPPEGGMGPMGGAGNMVQSLMDALNQSSTTTDGTTTTAASLQEQLLEILQGYTQYNQTGSSSASASTTKSLMNIVA